MDLCLSTVCLVASDKDQTHELDLKAEFFFSFFFFFPESKSECMGMGRQSKLFGSMKNCILIIRRILC